MAVSIVLSTVSSSASMLECAIGKRVDFNAMNSHSSGRSPKIKFDSTNTKFDSNGIGATYTGNVHNAPFYGTYSWGYLELGSRIGARDFKFYGQDGLGGISTSGFIQRFNPLRDKEYL